MKIPIMSVKNKNFLILYSSVTRFDLARAKKKEKILKETVVKV